MAAPGAATTAAAGDSEQCALQRACPELNARYTPPLPFLSSLVAASYAVSDDERLRPDARGPAAQPEVVLPGAADRLPTLGAATSPQEPPLRLQEGAGMLQGAGASDRAHDSNRKAVARGEAIGWRMGRG